MDNYGFLKVAAAVPRVKVGDCAWNASRLAALADEAAQRGVEIVVFPELALTGYTCGDLLLHGSLLDAADEVFGELMRATRKLPLTLIAGIPLRHGSTLYNCAAVFTQGRVLGVVPKSYIPDYSEFYENRWFASGAGISDEQIAVAGQQADFGADLTFEVNGTEFGVELCEDLWAAIPPSSQLALNGAKVIFNLSASPEAVGKHAYLRQLVAQQSARTIAGYVYCSAGFGESSTDLVFAGNGLIAENGRILREMPRFQLDEQLLVADLDIERIDHERRRNTSFRLNASSTENTVIEMEIPEGLRAAALDRAQANYVGVLLDALEETDNALSGISHSERRQENLRSAVLHARSAEMLARQEYEAGIGDYTMLLSTQRSLLSSQESELSNRAERANNYILLYRAIGGGWAVENAARQEAENPEPNSEEKA